MRRTFIIKRVSSNIKINRVINKIKIMYKNKILGIHIVSVKIKYFNTIVCKYASKLHIEVVIAIKLNKNFNSQIICSISDKLSN